MSQRLRKYTKLLQSPACWPALLRGVAATLDHDAALGLHIHIRESGLLLWHLRLLC